MEKNIKAYFELTLAMIIVGSSVVVGKVIIEGFPIFIASGLRFGIAAVILIIIFLKFEKDIPSLDKNTIMILFFQALTGVFGFSIFLLFGLKFTTASESGIITSTTPAVIAIISFVFLREKMVWQKWMGIAFAVLGIVAINVLGSSIPYSRGVNPMIGNLFIFGAVIGESLFTIFGKVASKKITPLAISTSVTVLGFIMFLPFALYQSVHFDFSSISINQWLAVIYYAIVVTVIGFILWYNGVSKVPASISAVFTGILPISSIVFSCIILKEEFHIFHLAGIVCVLLGIGFISIDFKKTQKSV